MSNAAPQFGRLLKPMWVSVAKNLTHWGIVGAIIALTGFGPEHWFAAIFQFVHVPEPSGHVWPAWLDIRVVIVCVGVAIIVADMLVRRRALHRQRARQEVSSGAPSAATPSPSADRTGTIEAQQSVPAGQRSASGQPARADAEGENPAAPALPDTPSIVVLPFTNMSGEAEQEFFADGLTEDILTELSRFRHLFIISRNTAFKYKGKAVDVRQVASELRVRYVVEGSVRKAGNRVRVTVQLIDGTVDRHIWAERYDRELADIFAIQDEVTAAIVATLPGRVEAATSERASRKPTDSMAAYECVLAGKLHHHRSTRADNEAALRLLDRALELDSNYAHAHAWKACTLGQSFVLGYCADREATWQQIGEEAETALRLDSSDSDVHRILAALNVANKNHDKAVHHQERALALNSNDDLIVVQQGEILTWLGRPEEGIQWIEKAMRLNPYHPERFWNHLGRANFVARRYADAIAAFKRITAPDHFHHAFLAACHAQLGDAASARAHAAEVLKRDPGFTVESYLTTLHYKRPEDREHHRVALLKAGLPAGATVAAAAAPAMQAMGADNAPA